MEQNPYGKRLPGRPKSRREDLIKKKGCSITGRWARIERKRLRIVKDGTAERPNN